MTTRLLRRTRSLRQLRLERSKAAAYRWLTAICLWAALALTAAAAWQHGMIRFLTDRPIGELVVGAAGALLVLVAFELRRMHKQRERHHADTSRELLWLRLALVASSCRIETAVYETRRTAKTIVSGPRISLRRAGRSAPSNSVTTSQGARLVEVVTGPINPGRPPRPPGVAAGSATRIATRPPPPAGSSVPVSTAITADVAEELEGDTILSTRTMVSPGQQLSADGP